ncbi:MAG: NADP-dependent isocitrate dehydrogenase, partial [Eudoraea sp.]
VLAKALDKATEEFLDNDKSPSRKVGELDTRGSHFYLGLYWARALANQEEDSELKNTFTKLGSSLEKNSQRIVEELIDAQGTPQDIGGYYKPDPSLMSSAMRPSKTLNSLLEQI